MLSSCVGKLFELGGNAVSSTLKDEAQTTLFKDPVRTAQ
jgi:hypothetical protein